MRKVKYRKSLVASVIGIFLLFNVLSIVLFTYYAKVTTQGNAISYAKQSMQEIVEEKSELISIRFDRIESHVQVLGTWMEKVLAKADISGELTSEYISEPDGTIGRKRDPDKSVLEQSNLFVPNTVEIEEEIIKEINATEELDEAFEVILKEEEVTWAYIATSNNLLRCSPYSNLQESFASNHSQSDDIFFTMANETNDPERVPVWTKPYTDYLGTGWTMTCSQPVYDAENHLYGVLCLDISIENIREKYFEDFNLGRTGKVMWLDKEGNIYYHTDYNVRAENQGFIYEKNIFEMEDISKEEKEIIRNVLKGGSGSETFSDGTSTQIMVYSEVEKLDSVLIIQMNKDEFQVQALLDFKKITMVLIVDLSLAFLVAYMLYYRFSRPMNNLVHCANQISKGDYSSIIEIRPDKTDYYEIAQLNQAFATMKENLQEYTETLREKNNEVNTILKSVEGTLMIANMDGSIRIQSKEAPGISEKELQKAIERIKEEKISFEEKVIKNGQIYKNRYYPIVEESGRIDKVVISSENITQNTLLEKELQQIEKMAGVGQLSAAIVHELKNALTRIKGAAYILNITGSDGEQSEIRTISKAVEDAENVITTLLDFSKRDSSDGEMVHIGTLVNQILLLSKKEVIGKNIRVNLDLDNDCYMFSTGREALKVILQNVILNAVQAVNYDGTIWISCRKEGHQTIIRVKDNGGGIKVEPKDKIFEPFLTTKDKGTGIGLWITKRLVDSLGGTIAASDSMENGGETEFVILIPEEEERQK